MIRSEIVVRTVAKEERPGGRVDMGFEATFQQDGLQARKRPTATRSGSELPASGRPSGDPALTGNGGRDLFPSCVA